MYERVYVCERVWVWARLVLSHTLTHVSCCVWIMGMHIPDGAAVVLRTVTCTVWQQESQLGKGVSCTHLNKCFFFNFLCFGCVVAIRMCFTPERKISFFPPVLNLKPPFCCFHLLPLSDIPTRLFVSFVPSGPPFFYIFNLLFIYFFCICSICHLAANPFLDVSLSLASSPAAWMALWLLPAR